VVEQDGDGNAIVFVPEASDTSKGNVLLAGRDQLTLMRRSPQTSSTHR
jgi:hypothetical protein